MPLSQFYRGVRRTDLRPGELLREIRVPIEHGRLAWTLPQAWPAARQAISVVNVALLLNFDGELVSAARVLLGCVAPTVVHALHVETFLPGKTLDA